MDTELRVEGTRDRCREWSRRLGMAGMVGALLLGAGRLGAQEKKPVGDLRCLTAEHCLPKPVPANEPHGAICATCHNLWEQRDLKEAASSCASGGCHAQPEKLTPYHRGLAAGVLENCLGCHPAHDARVRGESCQSCHRGGADGVGSRSTPLVRVAQGLEFRHRQHAAEKCSACHSSRERHGAVRVTTREACQSCHHTQPVAGKCVSCHPRSSLSGISRQVMLPANIPDSLAVALRPTLPYDHATHAGLTCGDCHSEGPSLTPTKENCTSCHGAHHQAGASCTRCHTQPPAGVHTRNVHLGCGGQGCHANAPESVRLMPHTREVCLVCHQNRAQHEVGKNCAGCHKLPTPRAD